MKMLRKLLLIIVAVLLCYFLVAVSQLESIICSISSWMTVNLLNLNPCKTEFMLIGLRQQLSKLSTTSLSLPSTHSILPCTSAWIYFWLFPQTVFYWLQSWMTVQIFFYRLGLVIAHIYCVLLFLSLKYYDHTQSCTLCMVIVLQQFKK